MKNPSKIKEINKKNLLEFLDVFLMLSFNKYDKEILKNLNDFCLLISDYFNNENNDFFSAENFKFIFIVCNKMIFKEAFGEDLNLFYDIKSVLGGCLDLGKYGYFYSGCVLNNKFNKESLIKQIKNLKQILTVTYDKKEHLKFNRNLIDFCGCLNLYFISVKEDFVENEGQDHVLENEVIALFEHVIKLNKGHIILETVNSYELLYKNMSKDDYKSEIVNQFFYSVLNSHNKEMNLPVLFGFFKFLYNKNAEILSFLFRKLMEKTMKIVRKFNSSLINNVYNTRDKLTNALVDLLDWMLIIQFLITLPYPTHINLSEGNYLKKLKSLINFFFTLFVDVSNEEYFEVAKIPLIYIQLTNLFIINLGVFTLENGGDFLLNEVNDLIILAMVNYSNGAKILKFSAFLLVLNIN